MTWTAWSVRSGHHTVEHVTSIVAPRALHCPCTTVSLGKAAAPLCLGMAEGTNLSHSGSLRLLCLTVLVYKDRESRCKICIPKLQGNHCCNSCWSHLHLGYSGQLQREYLPCALCSSVAWVVYCTLVVVLPLGEIASSIYAPPNLPLPVKDMSAYLRLLEGARHICHTDEASGPCSEEKIKIAHCKIRSRAMYAANLGHENVTHAFNLPRKLVFFCQSVARQTSKYLRSTCFLLQRPTCSHIPPTWKTSPIPLSSCIAQNMPEEAWIKTPEPGAFKNLCWGLNRISELGLTASEGASFSVPPSPCVLLLPCVSDLVSKALVRLQLPYPLYALPHCSDGPLTFFFLNVLIMMILLFPSLALSEPCVVAAPFGVCPPFLFLCTWPQKGSAKRTLYFSTFDREKI